VGRGSGLLVVGGPVEAEGFDFYNGFAGLSDGLWDGVDKEGAGGPLATFDVCIKVSIL
jgi:hypothetical protein